MKITPITLFFATVIIMQGSFLSANAQQGISCPDRWHMPVDGKCQRVSCNNDGECAKFQPYCSERGGQPFCRFRTVCGCNRQQSTSTGSTKSCNRNLNGNDKCPPSQVCLPNGTCVPKPNCAHLGETCSPQSKECCEPYRCHQRKGSSTFGCFLTAFVGESCTSGICCESGSYCIDGQCSLRYGDASDFDGAVCPRSSQCTDAPISVGVNKVCTI